MAHAAPATPIAGTPNVRPNTSTDGVPKMSRGSRRMFAPKPTTMHIIDRTALPSERIAAERPNAMWENTCENTTVRR